MNKKGGIELSINFIVIMIFSIVILVFGITLARNMFSKAADTQQEIDAKTQRQIASLLSGGSRVALPISSAELSPSQSESFGLGIVNTLGDTYKFHIFVEENYDSYNDPSLDILPKGEKVVSIKNNERYSQSVSVRVKGGVPEGAYVVDVEVCYEDADAIAAGAIRSCKGSSSPLFRYATMRKIYINVP